MRHLFILLTALLFLLQCGKREEPVATDGKVNYPNNYRSWVHAKSMVLQNGHALYAAFGGIHHIYLNDKAKIGMQKGGTFPDGAVIVFDLLEAKSENSAITEGARKVVGVMAKDTKVFSETGGWGFEGFKGDTRERIVTNAKESCFGCHNPQKEKDYVFSNYRE